LVWSGSKPSWPSSSRPPPEPPRAPPPPELQALVASRARRFGGDGYELNELTLTRYRGRGAGITAHRDRRRYRLLIAVLSLQGSARLTIVADRAASRPLASWLYRPGDIVLLRAPGWAGRDDGRPLHIVECDAGERLSLSLRMDNRVVHLPEPRSGPHGRHAVRDRHRAHRGHVDHDPCGRGAPREAVAPLRGTAGSPDRAANEITSATSAALAHSTTACGRASWKLAIAGLRASS
jgi:hypothetical protein